MGNCLVIQGRKVRQEALAEFPPGRGAISDDAQRQLDPAADVAVGRLYHLFPAKAPAVADPGAVRVRLVVSKQELRRMLSKEAISLDDMVSLMRKEASDRESERQCCRGWQPALESIPEGSDL